MGSLSPFHWIVVLIIVVLVFGTKKLRNVGKDLGTAVHDFKKGLNQGDEAENSEAPAKKEDHHDDATDNNKDA